MFTQSAAEGKQSSRVYYVYTHGIGSISNLYHIETVNQNTIIIQVLCKLLFYKLDTTGVYDLVYSTVHPMKYLESDVMRYKWYWGLFAKYKQVDNAISWLLLCTLSSQSLDGGEGLETKLWLSPHKLLCLLYQDYCDLTADSGFTTSAPKKQKIWVPYPGSSPPPSQRKKKEAGIWKNSSAQNFSH